jgi:hypothetical protein
MRNRGRVESNVTLLPTPLRPYAAKLQRAWPGDSMESLLRWGIENSVPEDEKNQLPRRDISQLDPGIIDQILGKPDAVQMKVSTSPILLRTTPD